jgi:hypothetical protein
VYSFFKASRDIFVLCVCVIGSVLVLCGHDVWFLVLYLCTYGFGVLFHCVSLSDRTSGSKAREITRVLPFIGHPVALLVETLRRFDSLS